MTDNCFGCDIKLVDGGYLRINIHEDGRAEIGRAEGDGIAAAPMVIRAPDGLMILRAAMEMLKAIEAVRRAKSAA